MKARVLLCVPLLLALSCSQRARVTHVPLVQTPSGVTVAMERQARNARYAGEGDLTARRLRERMVAEPDNLEVRLRLAEHYASQGSPELAVEHYRMAADRFPGSEETVLRLARTLRNMGLRAEAAGSLRDYLARRLDAGAEAHAWTGIILDELDRFSEGELEHRAALRRGKPSAYLHNNLGYNLHRQGKTAEAVAEFRKALSLEPDSEFARNNLALALAGSPQEAIQHWRSVSDPATAHNNLAAVLIEKGQYEEARKELNIALGYKPDHAAALRNLRLVSELLARPIAFQPEAPKTRWQRFGEVMGRVFLTPHPSGEQAAATSGAAPAASRED